MILYGVVAGARDHIVPADALYLAGVLPGVVMMSPVGGYAVRTGIRLWY